MIKKSLLNELLNYDPETGVLTWRERSDVRPEWNTRFVGKEAGSVITNGYRMIRINGSPSYAHRAIAIMQGWDIDGLQIDHIDGNRSNNKLCNLRVVTNKVNGKNQKLRSTNTSGVNGVYYDKNRGNWYVRFGNNGYGGRFATKEEAMTRRKEIDAIENYHHLHGTNKKGA